MGDKPPARRRPSFDWYANEWLGDSKVRRLTLEQRGLLADLKSLAHQGEPYGHLRQAGMDIHPSEIARLIGGLSAVRLDRMLADLLERGLLSRTPEGTLMVPDLVHHDDVRQRRAAGGVNSLRNPNVPRPKGDVEDTLRGHPTDHPPPVHAVASAVNASSSPAASETFVDLFARFMRRDVGENDTILLREVLERFGITYAGDARALRVLAEVVAALDGMHGPTMTWPELRRNLGDFLVLPPGTDVTPKLFRGYLYAKEKDRTVRAGAHGDEAQRLVTDILALQQRNGRSHFIPRDRVEALGEDVLEAYINVGGAQRFLQTEPQHRGFLVKSFENALQAARARAASPQPT
jgi:hypothetical protein